MSLRAFDATGPLAMGTTLVEASAGTGKTYGITNLFLRLVTERELSVDQILVVTFTNAATGELRERIRARLGVALSVLDGALVPDAGDAVLTSLSGVPEATRARFAASVRAALQGFDLAAISTIHGFCQRVMQLHAFESEAPFERELVTNTGPILEEIVDDYLSRELWSVDDATCAFLVGACAMNRKSLLALARTVTNAMDAPLLPVLSAATEPFEVAFARFRADVASFRQDFKGGWRAEVTALLEEALARKELNGSTYRTKWTETYLAKLDAWLAAPSPLGWSADESWCRYFFASQLAEKAKKAPPSHPMFEAWEKLARADVGWADLPRLAFSAYARRELRARLDAQHALSFDEMLRALRERLEHPLSGPPLRQGIRSRLHAALIDEFQDTDATQWAIFSKLFGGDGAASLFLIGDPKQAIYSFRGADVFVYDQAKRETFEAQRFTMSVNQRADGRLVQAMNALFGERPGIFDLDFIAYVDVAPAARNVEGRARFADPRAPLTFRWIDADSTGSREDTKATLTKGAMTRLVPELVATEIVELLGGGGALREGAEWRPIRPQDVAVLVRTNKQARAVHAALLGRGIPAVVGQAGSVFLSDEALSLQRWLEAVVAPGRDAPARLLAVTPLFGWTAHDLDEAREEDSFAWTKWIARLARLRQTLDARGFAAAFDDMLEHDGVIDRLLRLPDGERRITNLRHLAELVNVAERADRLGAAGLLQWMRARRAEDVTLLDETELRLESDADAVKVTTLHASKGLEYPVVLLPYLWDGLLLHPGDKDSVRFHDPDTRALTIDLRLDDRDPEKQEHKAYAEEEALQENLRLLYVAFTRAKHLTIAYAGAVKGYETSALAVVLHGGPPGPSGGRRTEVARTRVGAALEKSGSDAELRKDLEALVESARLEGATAIAWTRAKAERTKRYVTPNVGASPSLDVRTFDRAGPDLTWRRVSYTALTAGKELEREGEDWDEVDAEGGAERDDVGLATRASADDRANVPLFAFPRGPEAGKLVHLVLEELDFTTLREKRAPKRSLEELVAVLGERAGVGDPQAYALLAAELPAALHTRLGAAAGDLRLADLTPSDRLDELRFDLPLAGGAAFRTGDRPIGGAELTAIFQRRKGDAVMSAPYLAALATLELPALVGFLTGSIDLTFRAHMSGREQWFIADYKTNLLGARVPGLPLTSTRADYGHAGLREAMETHHYYVQYHLYLVALHRYLAWRKPGYDYDRDIGGALYLFLRGMVGESTAAVRGRVDGVFFDKPPREVIEGISELFARSGGDR